VSVGVHSIVKAQATVALLSGRFRDGGDSLAGRFRWVQFDLPGPSKLEMIEPLDPDDSDNFLVRFLASSGEGIHHVTLKVTDIQLAVARAIELGMVVVGVNTGHEAWKEAFVHPRSANGVLVQLAEWTDGAPSGKTLADVVGRQ
jgi:methylmalonyl-CoA/ethylmalonyl-CoA epimerase